MVAVVLLAESNEVSNAGILLRLVISALYFLPTILAVLRGHHNSSPILVINIFLGWTFIGWVVSLAMSLSALPPQEPPPRRRRRIRED